MNTQTQNQVFMYGSNLNLKRLHSRASGWNGQFIRAFIPSYALHFNKQLSKGGVAANIMSHPTRKVWGILVELNDDDLEKMDMHEGHPNHYERKKLDLFSENSSHVSAYIYTAHPKCIVKGQLPRSEYLGHIIKGAKMCGLPSDYINAIEALGRGIV